MSNYKELLSLMNLTGDFYGPNGGAMVYPKGKSTADFYSLPVIMGLHPHKIALLQNCTTIELHLLRITHGIAPLYVIRLYKKSFRVFI